MPISNPFDLKSHHQFNEYMAEKSPNLSIRVPPFQEDSDDPNTNFDNSTLRLKTETSDVLVPKTPTLKSSTRDE